MSDRTLPPKGWYKDPHNNNSRRYWTGSKWSITEEEYRQRLVSKQAYKEEELEKSTKATYVKSKETISKNGIIDTDVNNGSNGLNKCPQCGSAEVKKHNKENFIYCSSCRSIWDESTGSKINEKYALNSTPFEIFGFHRTTRSENIDQGESSSLAVIKCQGCGAEVTIDSSKNYMKSCHWCRQTLSLNTKVADGAVPDGILPFQLSKKQAGFKMEEYLEKLKKYADRNFMKSFDPDRIVGVYMPYLVVDGNLSASLSGFGEKVTDFKIRNGDGGKNTVTFDVEEYAIKRSFDLGVQDHAIESSSNKNKLDENSNNIINAILPFDTENLLEFDSRYMLEHNSERRDLNIDEVTEKAYADFLSMARNVAHESSKQYNHGARWDNEHISVKGVRWATVYLPVWIYSYYHKEKRNKEETLHYIAVNGRTGETHGSIPPSRGRLLGLASIPSITFASVATLLAGSHMSSFFDGNVMLSAIPTVSALLVASPIGFYIYKYAKKWYYNQEVRHVFEEEANMDIVNYDGEDYSTGRKYKTKDAVIPGDNVSEYLRKPQKGNISLEW